MRASGRTILKTKTKTKTKTKKPAERAFLLLKWLGCRDSNPGMLVSETRALPLGDTPIALNKLLNDFLNWLGYEDSNLGMPESESGALPLGDTPTMFSLPNRIRQHKYGGYDGIRTCDPIIMSDVL